MTAEYLQQHWLALVVLAAAVALGVAAALRPAARRGWLVAAGMAALVGLGGLVELPSPWPWGLSIASAAALILLVALLAATGWWSSWLGVPVFAAVLLTLGCAVLVSLGQGLIHAGRLLLSLEPLEPAWLFLLAAVPWLIWFSYRRLAALGGTRRWLAIGARSLIVILVVFALAEMHARRSEDRLTVLFLWDRSLSVPAEYEGEVNKREERIKKFINDSVMKRGPAKDNDRVGLIVFGRQPRLELPPSAVPQLKIQKIQSPVDDTYTDIASAIKLAIASFPESSSKRIVLVSDGNENLGNAEEQARLARQNGVEIDVLPIAGARRNPNEVLVERVDAPSQIEKDSRISLRVLLRSFSPQIVAGKLQLYKISLDARAPEGPDAKKEGQPVFETRPVLESVVKLKYGLNPFTFSQPGTKKDDAYVYEVKFVPLHVENAAGLKLQEGFPGDRVENNRASVSVMARGQRAVLLIEPKVGDHELLANRLRVAKSSLQVVPIEPAKLPQNSAELAMVLSKFDCILIANVPAESLTDTQQKVIRSVVYDQGVGLVVIGGNQSYGAGGWQNTEVEKALPVTSELKSMKIEGKSGLVMIMHASEMAEGNAWQRKIAKLALEKLSPMDMVGQLHFDHQTGKHEWHIPFVEIGNNRNRLIGLVDSMVPGDMPDVDPALIKSFDALTNPAHGLGTKHIIFISDGDHWDASVRLLDKIRAAKITVTTICITTHGQAEIQKMGFVAARTGGRAYHVKDPTELPAIYIKETRLVSQAWVHEKEFQPILLRPAFGPTEGMTDLEPLHGFNRTSKRPSPLVTVAIETPKIGEYKFPLLAHWHYGLGKSVAFMSDARTQPGGKVYWDRDWANAPLHAKFWEQTVDWSLRALETGKHLQMYTEQRDGKIRVVLEAKGSEQKPITDLEIVSGLTSPSFKGPEGRRKELEFKQKNSGIYEAELSADEVGAYFINVQAKWTENGQQKSDGIRAGVSIPYSPEFAEMESNPTLLEKLREITGGKSYIEDPQALARAAEQGDVFRAAPQSHHSLQPLWFWLVALAGMLLLFDVAVRRIAIEPAAAWATALGWWERLRGRQLATAGAGEFLDRLKSRKVQVGETIEKEKATRRFEGAGAAPVTADPGATAMPKETPPRTAPTKPAPKKQEAEDYATRLLKAKKRALEDRDKEK